MGPTVGTDYTKKDLSIQSSMGAHTTSCSFRHVKYFVCVAYRTFLFMADRHYMERLDAHLCDFGTQYWDGCY